MATARITLAGMGHRAIFVTQVDWQVEEGVELLCTVVCPGTGSFRAAQTSAMPSSKDSYLITKSSLAAESSIEPPEGLV